MTTIFRVERLTEGADRLAGALTKIASEGWALHSLMPWGGFTLGVFFRTTTP